MPHLIILTYAAAILPAATLSFQTPRSYSTGSEPMAVAAGDFNGDGKPDLAAMTWPSTVQVFLGNGNGTFRPAKTAATVQLPSGMAVGDFNGDGKLDVAIMSAGNKSITVLLGNGNGTFYKTPINTSAPLQSNSIAVGDVNGDGKLDVSSAVLPKKSQGVADGIPVIVKIRARQITVRIFGQDAPPQTIPPGHVDLALWNGDDRDVLAHAGW